MFARSHVRYYLLGMLHSNKMLDVVKLKKLEDQRMQTPTKDEIEALVTSDVIILT